MKLKKEHKKNESQKQTKKTATQNKKQATLIFPNQLFQNHPAIIAGRPIYLIEDARFFTDFSFHKQKLVFHRASMKNYADQLKKEGLTVFYIEYPQAPKIFEQGSLKKVTFVHYVDPVDTALEARLKRELRKHKIGATVYESPAFLCSREWLATFFKGKKHFAMRPFYIEQRKRLHILVKDKKPIGGSWSFDTKNRKPLPKNIKIPAPCLPTENKYIREARLYVAKHFPKNPGLTDTFIYPTTTAQAKKCLQDFLKNKLKYFGDYQDAMHHEQPFLFHSLLSPALNTGLLTPAYVIQETQQYAQKHAVPINSLEGFIRQIIGWREFVRAVYILAGKKQRKSNFFKHTNSLPNSFWTASTGIEPLDNTMKNIQRYAYAHHIERLMVLGNFMLLSETAPDDVYTWFMEHFIDAYDWVMVPNVYGMSQYADGGIMTTKPYISSSRYIQSMSNYKKGTWEELWNALYWHFIYTKKSLLQKNGRLAIMAFYLHSITSNVLMHHIKVAKKYLKSIQ
ncbi:cryptochrome/photolyase family protein [Candidatus Dependentiae bacterium HGW-Dependentiae-1]|nr:MAG: cryptochrome/photolyase family protein [Candidatus Dependentiae bacterium HGW-Dependentiae-1]